MKKIIFIFLAVFLITTYAHSSNKIDSYPVSQKTITALLSLKKQMMDFHTTVRNLDQNVSLTKRLQSRYTLAKLESDVANFHTILVALQIEATHGERGQVHEELIYVLEKMIAVELNIREDILADTEKDENYDFDSNVSGLPAKHYEKIVSFRKKIVTLLKQAKNEINMTMNIIGKTK